MCEASDLKEVDQAIKGPCTALAIGPRFSRSHSPLEWQPSLLRFRGMVPAKWAYLMQQRRECRMPPLAK
jgi:hypothetical protein